MPNTGFFFPGTADVAIEAVDPGMAANVPADVINQVEDGDVDQQLRQGAPQNRRVRNDGPTEGGTEQELNVVRRMDVVASGMPSRATWRRSWPTF